jgi:pimeloyl-ACP methyl ester carboxylesterase
VRDIQKTWYTEGISNTVPSIDALHLLLKELTQDYNKIICVGNSAGGYAAMLFGALLKAEIIYSFSGFVYLDKEICSDPLNPKLALAEANPKQKKWLDIREIIRKSKSEIFFFYPFYSEADRKQVASIQSCSNITFIPIDSDIHGIGPSSKLYASLFSFKYELFKRKIQKKNRKLSISELDDLIEFNRNYIQQFAGIMKQLRQSIYRRINFFKIL